MSMSNILDYGAVPDGRTLCTGAIQRAIDLCEKGGTVYIPKGTFLSGGVRNVSVRNSAFENTRSSACPLWKMRILFPLRSVGERARRPENRRGKDLP